MIFQANTWVFKLGFWGSKDVFCKEFLKYDLYESRECHQCLRSMVSQYAINVDEVWLYVS